MKCQKCGGELVTGHLLCDICGAEYQIVPDFEPEIELSIAESMTTIAETMEEKETEEPVALDFEKSKFKVPSFSTILILVIVVFLFLYTGYHSYTSTLEYRSTRAFEAMNEGDYYKASQIYASIRKEYPQDAGWYVKEANAKMMIHKPKDAYHLALLAIKAEENTDLAYEFLLEYLKKEENYIEMNEILKNCEYEEIRQNYREYLCEIPALNYKSGSYDKFLELSFLPGYEGTIYYTLDGTIPTVESSKYMEPIQIGNGQHVLTCIYENAYGIFSEPAVFEYQVVSDTPMAPTVKLESGRYSNVEMIEVEVEEGTRVFYTTDLTNPTLESMEYTVPIPLPLGESQFNFVAYSSKGLPSAITCRNYVLDLNAVISIEEAQILLMQKLIDTEYILNYNGSVKDRYGVFHYFYKYAISENGHNYYIFEEHYMENQINNPLNRFYAVEVNDGSVFKMVSEPSGRWIRTEF